MSKFIDLHMHSINSDGQFNPLKLTEISKKNNVYLMSITDHDDIKSALDIKKINNIGIKYVNGVELSSITKINNENKWLHILGYGFDENNDQLNSKLKEKKNIRYITNHNYLINLLKEFSFIDEDILEKVECHKFIRLSRLIDNYINTKDFTKEQLIKIKSYLDNIKPIYPNYEFIDKEAIELIKSANGFPILAHPYQYHLSEQEEINLLKKLKSYGLVGIEKYHSGDTKEGMKLQNNLCNMFNFEWTAGSDFHTDYDDFGNEIGYGKNNNLCINTCSLIKKLDFKIYKV